MLATAGGNAALHTVAPFVHPNLKMQQHGQESRVVLLEKGMHAISQPVEQSMLQGNIRLAMSTSSCCIDSLAMLLVPFKSIPFAISSQIHGE